MTFPAHLKNQYSSEPTGGNFKLFSIFTALFTLILVVSTISASKIFSIGPFNFPGGIILFPIAFIFNDILTEVYGYTRSRQVIWIGFAGQIIAALTLTIVGALPPAPFWHNHRGI